MLAARSTLAAAVLALTLAATGVPAGHAQTMSPEVVKGAFVYNILNFVQWPADSLPPGEVLTVAVLAGTPMDAFVSTLSAKPIRNRPIQIRVHATADTIGTAHVVFVAADRMSEVARVVRLQGSRPVLTIGEDQNPPAPTIINLTTANTRLIFHVNLDAADAAGLRLTSNFIALARAVHSSRSPVAGRP